VRAAGHDPSLAASRARVALRAVDDPLVAHEAHPQQAGGQRGIAARPPVLQLAAIDDPAKFASTRQAACALAGGALAAAEDAVETAPHAQPTLTLTALAPH